MLDAAGESTIEKTKKKWVKYIFIRALKWGKTTSVYLESLV